MKPKFSFLIVLLAIVIGTTAVSAWILNNHFAITPGQESPFQNIKDDEIPKDLRISLQSSVCYGTCPDFTVTVTGDGTVVFEGREFVKEKKTVKSMLSREKIRELLAEFDKAKYFSLKDKYRSEEDGCPTVWTDNPSVNTSITINGKTKSIAHYYGCQEKDGNSVYPKALTELEKSINRIIDTGQWIK